MTNPQTDTLYTLIREVRTAFNRLKSFADEMNRDDRITAAMRALLEHLDTNGPGTVPNIARAKSVSRQHIQLLADALAEAGLVRFAVNPGHKRSKLVNLTAEGAAAFAAIRAREAQALADLAGVIAPGDRKAAIHALQALNAALEQADPRAY